MSSQRKAEKQRKPGKIPKIKTIENIELTYSLNSESRHKKSLKKKWLNPRAVLIICANEKALANYNCSPRTRSPQISLITAICIFGSRATSVVRISIVPPIV